MEVLRLKNFLKTLWPFFMDKIQLPQSTEPLQGGSLLFTTESSEIRREFRREID